MVALSDTYSRSAIEGLLQCLTERRTDQERRRDRNPRLGWSDGRERFGTVSGAVRAVLAEATGELAIREVQAAVEGRLGRPVSFQTVSDYLMRRSKGERPLFERTRYGHYACRRHHGAKG